MLPPKSPIFAISSHLDIEEARDSLHLAPGMLERVFRYAKDSFIDVQVKKSTPEFPASASSSGSSKKLDGVQKDVYEGALVREVLIPHPDVAFSLRHALGISSDAPLVSTRVIEPALASARAAGLAAGFAQDAQDEQDGGP